MDLSIILTLCPRVHEVRKRQNFREKDPIPKICKYFLVQQVTLANTGLTNEDLYTLMQLDMITSLSISAEREPRWDFYEGLAPLLQVKGLHMESLIVTDFFHVDVTGRSQRFLIMGFAQIYIYI